MKKMNLRFYCSHTQVFYMIAVAIGQSLWGISYLFTKVALQFTTTEILLSMRFIVSFLLMNIPILCGKVHISFQGKNLKYVLMFAILQPIYFFLESQGILYTNSAFAGVLLSLTPIVSIVFAKIAMNENPPLQQILFCFLPITGVIMMTLANSHLGAIQPIGVIFLFLTCIVAALITIVNKKAAQDFTSFERTYATLLSNSIVYTILALHSVQFNIQEYLQPLNSDEYKLSVLALAILCSIVASLFVNSGAKELSVAKFSIFSSLTTIVAMIAGVCILHEPMTTSSFIGSLLIIIGIWKVNTYQKESVTDS